MKQNKLYTVNKWNRPAFIPHEYGDGGLVFDDYGLPDWKNSQEVSWNSYSNSNTNAPAFPYPYKDAQTSFGRSNPLASFQMPTQEQLKDLQSKLPQATADDGNHNWFGISKENNPFSKQNIGGTMQGIAGAALNTETGDKLLDVADPMYHIAGGRESAVGNGLSDAGKGLFKAGAQTGNGWLIFLLL